MDTWTNASEATFDAYVEALLVRSVTRTAPNR